MITLTNRFALSNNSNTCIVKRMYTRNSCVIQIDANLFQSTTTTVDKYVEGDNFGTELLSVAPG